MIHSNMSKQFNPKAQGTRSNPARIQQEKTSEVDAKVLRTRKPIFVRVNDVRYLVEPVGAHATSWKVA